MSNLRWVFLVAAAAPCLSHAIDLDGKWVGKTICPLGPVSFTADIKERTGTFSYRETGPARAKADQFPIAIRTRTGWEGEWVYLERPGQNSADYKQFGRISGLLSPDGYTMTVRGQGIGACREFTLSRPRPPEPPPPPEAPAGPNPEGREPTGTEMRAAVERLLALAGTVSINSFKKIDCTPDPEKPGYRCRYKAGITYHSNASVHNELFARIFGSQNLPEQAGFARFWYERSNKRWSVQKVQE